MSNSALKYLVPINELHNDQWDQINKRSVSKSFPVGTVLAKNEFRNWYIYLLDGEVSVVNKHGHQHFLLSDNERFKKPLFGDLDGFNEVTSNSDINIIMYDRNLYSLLKHNAELESEVLETISVDKVESEIFDKVFSAYSSGTIEVPSLPDIAIKIRKAVENTNVSIEDIAHIVEADPAIAAHLLKLANGPMNRTINPILSIRDAVMRLGVHGTRDYVLVITISNLFKTKSPLLKKIMKEFYTHSVQVAAMCLSIARLEKSLKPESALLAGLLHDIGVIPILNYASQISTDSDIENEIFTVIEKLKPLVGSMMLKQWGLDESFICVAENSENWFRDDSKKLDYGDLVVISQLQNYIRPQLNGEVPDIETVPAFKKIKLLSDDPDLSNKILQIAHEELHEVMSLLSN